MAAKEQQWRRVGKRRRERVHLRRGAAGLTGKELALPVSLSLHIGHVVAPTRVPKARRGRRPVRAYVWAATVRCRVILFIVLGGILSVQILFHIWQLRLVGQLGVGRVVIASRRVD